MYKDTFLNRNCPSRNTYEKVCQKSLKRTYKWTIFSSFSIFRDFVELNVISLKNGQSFVLDLFRNQLVRKWIRFTFETFMKHRRLKHRIRKHTNGFDLVPNGNSVRGVTRDGTNDRAIKKTDRPRRLKSPNGRQVWLFGWVDAILDPVVLYWLLVWFAVSGSLRNESHRFLPRVRRSALRWRTTDSIKSIGISIAAAGYCPRAY